MSVFRDRLYIRNIITIQYIYLSKKTWIHSCGKTNKRMYRFMWYSVKNKPSPFMWIEQFKLLLHSDVAEFESTWQMNQITNHIAATVLQNGIRKIPALFSCYIQNNHIQMQRLQYKTNERTIQRRPIAVYVFCQLLAARQQIIRTVPNGISQP